MATDLQTASRVFLIEMTHIKSLRGLNLIVALVHSATIFLFAILNIHYTLPVVIFNATEEAGKLSVRTIELAQVDIFYLVIAYLAIAAVSHLLIATVFFSRYTAYIKQHRNPIRWVEYSLSCSIMLVALSLSTGIAHFGVLFTIFFASFTMSLSGLVFENVNRKTQAIVWSPFVLGSILGTLPWLLLYGTLYTFDGSSGDLFSRVQLVYALVLFLFILFPLNTYFSVKRIGPWKSYITTEMGYMTLSYLAKTILAILLYFNLLRIT